MPKILKIIDLTDHVIRRALFAVLDRLAAEHRTTARQSVGLSRVVSWHFDPGQVQR
jgi:hypothetical protein